MMKIVEQLYLIPDSKYSTFDKSGFAKELKVKSDDVGWMRLDIGKEMDKLKQISELAKSKGLKLRGRYEKKVQVSSARWYRFSPRNRFAVSDYSYSQKHGEYWFQKIKAYKAPKGCNVIDGLVSQTFVDKCRELRLTGLDFIWIPDNGKYRAVSFYKPIFIEKAKKCIYPGIIENMGKKTYIPVTLEPIPDKFDLSTVRPYYKQADFPEGRLCEIEPFMDDLDVILPLALEYDSMPDTDFAYCFLRGFIPISLIRDSALEKLIQADVVTRDDFEPVMSIDAEEQDLLIQECDTCDNMKIMLENKAHFEKMRLELQTKERPEFVPSEKEVLALLRSYKKKYPEYLNRAISKVLSEEVSRSLYSPLLPYYKVACGGRLAEDTYEYFHYETAIQKNAVWHQGFAADERSDRAVLFGSTGDGDLLILYGEQVFEISCHGYEVLNSWDHIYLFFYEKVEG